MSLDNDDTLSIFQKYQGLVKVMEQRGWSGAGGAVWLIINISGSKNGTVLLVENDRFFCQSIGSRHMIYSQ